MQVRDRWWSTGALWHRQALCRRFARARGVVVADRDATGASQVAKELAVSRSDGCQHRADNARRRATWPSGRSTLLLQR